MTYNGSRHNCDRCGTGVENGAVTECVVVSDLDPDNPGMVRNLHFCRENGCDKKVLSARNLQHYTETRESSNESESGTADQQ